MLQTIRDHSRGWLAMALLGLLVIAFAIWGIDSPFTNRTIIAEVNGEEVPPNLILNAYRNQLNSYQSVYPAGIPPLQQEKIKRDVLDSFVSDRVLNQHTESAGFRISDQVLTDFIRERPEFQIDGSFSIDLFKQRALQVGLDARSYESQIRQTLRKFQIRDGLMDSSFVTKAELAKRGALESETRTVEYFVVPASKFTSSVVPDESMIKAEYDKNRAQYVTDESVQIEYIELSREDLAADVDVDETQLRSHYDDAVESGIYRKEETRQGRHILVAVSDDAEDEAARSRAAELLTRVEAGEDFAALASEFSDDPGSKPEGGLLDWSSAAAFVGPFRDALFAMDEGEIRGPIRTRFGYHVLRLEGIRADETKPFEEVRDEIERDYRFAGAEGMLGELGAILDEAVYDNDDTLVPAAQAAGLTVETTGWFTRAGGSGVANEVAIRNAAFSDRVLLERRNSSAIGLDDSYLYIRIKDHRASAERPLDEVRPSILEALRQRLASDRAAEVGRESLQRLRDGVSLVELAAEVEGEAKTVAVTRNSSDVPNALRLAVFSAAKPSDGPAPGGVILDDGGFAVYSLSEVVAGEAADPLLADRIAQATGASDLAAFVAALRDEAKVVVNPESLQ